IPFDFGQSDERGRLIYFHKLAGFGAKAVSSPAGRWWIVILSAFMIQGAKRRFALFALQPPPTFEGEGMFPKKVSTPQP
ncbi:MAG: hypothetical protein K8I30_20065, partial [Anaerolineae bacterium]|nr:hypothetical protein [Anaerolineae bacterium]